MVDLTARFRAHCRLWALSVSSLPDCANKPWRTAGALPGPILLEIILARLEVASGEEYDQTDQAIEYGIHEDTTVMRCQLWILQCKKMDSRDETVCYAVAERDEGDDDEGRKDVADVSPVDLRDLAYHHAPHLSCCQ